MARGGPSGTRGWAVVAVGQHELTAMAIVSPAAETEQQRRVRHREGGGWWHQVAIADGGGDGVAGQCQWWSSLLTQQLAHGREQRGYKQGDLTRET